MNEETNYNSNPTVTDLASDRMKRSVMRRVYAVYWLRTIRQFFPVSIVAPVVFLIATAFFVSIPHVVQNFIAASQNINSAFAFIISALTNTTVAIQLLSAALVVSTTVFAHDVLRRFMLKSTHGIFAKRSA